MAQLKATYKEILRIAFPLIIGNAAWTFNGIFDTIFVGNLGKIELDAIGFASIFYSVLFLMGFSFTRGTQILIARSLGAGQKKEVGNVFDNTLVAMLSVSAVFFVLIKMYANTILSFMLTNPEIIEKSNTFLDCRMWGLVPSFLSFVFIAFYSGIGQTTMLMLSITVMTILNIVLNYTLVYGKFGMPALGICGSGMATSISETIAVGVLVLGTFYKQRAREFSLYRFSKFDWLLVRQITNISVPLMLQSLAAVGGWLYFFARIETVLGKEALAISTIYRQLILFFTIPTWSLGSTANTIISNLAGQRNLSAIRQAVWRISVVSFAFAVVASIVIAITPQFYIKIFTNAKDHDLVPAAVQALPIIYITFLLMSFSNIVFNGVISLGDIYHALLIQVVAVVLYIGYFQVLFAGPYADIHTIWTAEWVYWLAMFTGAMAYFKWRKIPIIETQSI